MIVLDASAAVDWLLQTPAGIKIEERIFARSEPLAAPHLIDVEVAQVLRRLARQGNIAEARAEEVMEDLAALPIVRYEHTLFLPRVWQLRNSLSACDAVYISLSEALAATLLTRDLRLKSAAGHTAMIETF